MLAKKFRFSATVWEKQRHERPLRVINTELLTLRSFKTPFPHPRIGVVVGTKVDKRATVRNRIRRAIYDGLHRHFNKLAIADYTCMVRPDIKNLTRKEIIQLIDKLF